MLNCIKIFFGAVILLFIFGLNAKAQENLCNLEVFVTESTDSILLIGVDITVKNLSSKVVTDSGSQFERYYFRNLPEGNYEISARREGYKESIYQYNFNCAKVNPQGFKYFSITLWAGNENEKVFVEKKVNNQPNQGTLTVVSDKELQSFREERQRKWVKINKILNNEAVILVKPQYPLTAKSVRASGVVYVWVKIDNEGKIIEAKAVSGHPLLLAESVKAAKESQFKAGQDAPKSGYIIYNFTL